MFATARQPTLYQSGIAGARPEGYSPGTAGVDGVTVPDFSRSSLVASSVSSTVIEGTGALVMDNSDVEVRFG
jgi:hypothetical protein